MTPPTQPMKHMTIEDGNTRKSTQRPPRKYRTALGVSISNIFSLFIAPTATPTNFTTTSMKVASSAGPKGSPPIAKPAPPPVKRPGPPPVSGGMCIYMCSVSLFNHSFSVSLHSCPYISSTDAVTNSSKSDITSRSM